MGRSMNLHQWQSYMRRRNKGRSGAVRREQFDRSLDAMNYEMADKTARSMAKYHTLKVEPLEGRIRTIELVLGIALVRWCYWTVADTYHRFYMRFTESVPDPSLDALDALVEEEGVETDAPISLLEPMADPEEEEIKQAVRRPYPH